MKPTELLEQMSTEQKVSLVCGKDFWHTQAFENLSIPELVFSDGPHGIRYQAHAADHLGLNTSKRSTCFPTSSCLAGSWDRELAREVGMALGKEAAVMGVDVLLAPGINMIRNPAGGRSFEYFSEDPFLTGELAASQVQGIQKYVAACPKHFYLNSQETMRMSVDERVDDQTLHELYLPAFAHVIAKGNPDWIMTSYNKVNGIYTHESPQTYALLKELGFDGAVVSDWGGSNSQAEALRQGGSLEMPGTFGHSVREVLEAIRQGTLKEEDLDKRVLEVLEAIEKAQKRKEERMQKYHKRQGRQPLGTLNANGVSVDYLHHHILALKAAARSVVLLENKGILPLKDQKVCWIGPFDSFPMQGAGSSKVEPFYDHHFKALLRISTIHSVGTARGYKLDSLKPDLFLEAQAYRLAAASDVIIFLAAFSEQEQLEGMDRKLHAIPDNQVRLYKRLLAMNKPVILIDAISNAIEIPEAGSFAAILYMGLAGQAGREALLQILTGKSSPEGRLPVTFAKSWMDHPSSASFPETGPISWHTEGMHTGYRAFDQQEVLYPFGYGLSYTSFACSHFELNSQSVSCVVTNTGERDGAFVLQLYVRKPGRDYKELIGFEKIRLKSHQSRSVSIPLLDEAFESWNPASKRFEPLAGIYQIELAENARDVLHSWQLEKEGTIHARPETLTVLPLQTSLASDRPLHEFQSSSSLPVRMLAKGVVKIRDRSLAHRKPNMLAISLADMPLKGFAKISGNLIHPGIAEAFLQEASQPSLSNKIKLMKSFFQPRPKAESSSQPSR